MWRALVIQILWIMIILFLGGTPFFATFAQNDLGPITKLFRVDSVIVEGNRRVEEEAIKQKIYVRVGDHVDNYTLKDDIQRIYGMKYFQEVEAYKRTQAGKEILVIKVKEKAVVSDIKFRGNSEVKDDDLLAVLSLKKFNILDINSIKADLKALQKLYEDKGFFLAVVDYRLVQLENDQVELIYDIQELDKVKIKKVSFLGNKFFSDAQLKDIMLTKEDSLFSFISDSSSFKEVQFQRDVEVLKYFYKTKGHLQINVGTPEVTISEDKKWVFITIKVTEGPSFTVNSVRYEGDLLFDEEKFRESTELKENLTYSEEILQNDIRNLTELYQDEGYAFANVLRTLETIPGENKVDIIFSFEKGKLADFGKITVKGNSKTRDKVVRRELTIEEGKRFSGSELRKSRENVNRLGFFEPGSVIFNTSSPPGRDDVLDVEIVVKERNTGQISLGAGYSTNDKGFFQASVAENNFLGRGQRLEVESSLGSRNQNYSVSFTEPYLFDTKWTGGAELFYQADNRQNDYRLLSKGSALRLGHPVAEYTRLFLTHKLDKRKLQDANEQLINLALENGLTSSVALTLQRDKRDNIMEPSNGYFWSIGSEFAGVGGNREWLRYEADLRFYKKIWGDLVLRYRFMGEKLDYVNDQAIPYSVLLSLGGSRNMRGYGVNRVGPIQERFTRRNLAIPVDRNNASTYDRVNFNERGRLSMFSTVEFEHPLAKEAGLKWVVFADAGNVYKNRIGDSSGPTLLYDYGFGIRWFSPIGILRFEFGYPINPRNQEENRQQFYFDLGQIF
jgi:outer membrane protein insertion porin family